MKNFNKTIILLLAAQAILFSACSYAVDVVERAITKRASFSIEATYNQDGTVTIRWDESGGSNFAGYEIYMTEEKDNEYAGYVVIGAGYAISSSSLFKLDTNLLNEFAFTFTTNDIKSIKGAGRFFFRVGIIEWDEDPDDRTSENGYTGNDETDYKANTDIAEISGSLMVNIN